MLNVSCGGVKQFENNVDDLGFAGPWLDKGWLDSIYASIIVTVLERRVEDSLEKGSQPIAGHSGEDGAPERRRWLQIGRQSG